LFVQEKFLRGKGVPNLSKIDIHVVCGAIKDFLRSLLEPLVTYTLWQDFVKAAETSDPEDARAAMYQAISELPQPNRDTLAFLIMHLQR
jgi:Rac GTPase-activating protein 1